jgi:hypothetical protein
MRINPARKHANEFVRRFRPVLAGMKTELRKRIENAKPRDAGKIVRELFKKHDVRGKLKKAVLDSAEAAIKQGLKR